MKVKRLPVDTGESGWNAILPPPDAAEELSAEVSADFLVIGAGFAGLATARRLAEIDDRARVAILDATRVGRGPAGRNTGFMIDLPHRLVAEGYAGHLEEDLLEAAANREGIRFARRMAEEFGLGGEAFAMSGKVNAAATERGCAHNLAYARHLEDMGEERRMLDASEMAELTGTDYYAGGLFTPGAAMIQPAMFVRGVARGLGRSGVSVYENSPVLSLDRRDGVWLARTPRGSARAPRAILCVNGHANSFGRFRRRLLHVHLYASMTRALTEDERRRLGGASRWGATPADPLGSTVRRISGTGGDRIVVRNRFTCDPSIQVSEGRLARMARTHDASFAARFPMLAGVGMEYRWAGRLCLSRNAEPALGEIDEGLFSACCQNGLGAAKGTLHGMLMAEMASGRRSELLDRALARPGPSRLPPEPFAAIGANARLRWGEYMAGREI